MTTRWQKMVGALALVVVFWVGDRLYEVIDRGGTGAGAEHGPDRTSTSPAADTGDPIPGGGHGGHDPSRFGH